MMNFDVFKKMIVVEMEQRVGVGNVAIERITKNNATKMNGLIIQENNRNMAPVINLDSFYKELREKPFPLLVDEIWKLYQSGKTKSDIDLSTFLKWESIKDKVVMKVINYKYNRELLKQVPHYKYLDLAVVYYLIIDREKDGEATIMINNQHLEMWSIRKNELQEAAYSNYGKFYLPYIRKLDEVIMEMRHIGEKELDGETPLYVITNQRKTYGATLILFPEIFRVISEVYGENLYILPSSIHELLVLPESLDYAERLKGIVREVNSTCLEQVELLSDNVYMYKQESGSIIIAGE